MDAAAVAQQSELLADWMVGGIAVLCALVALRAASGGSWIVRLALGPVAVGSVLAAFLMVLVHRSPIDSAATPEARGVRPSPPVATAAEPKAPADRMAAAPIAPETESPAASELQTVPGHEPPEPKAAAVEAPRDRELLFATDRARLDRDGAGYGSQGAGRLELGRVRLERLRRAAMARPVGVSATDAAGSTNAAITETSRIETLDGQAWGAELAKESGAGASKRHAVVVVHGFDTTFDDSIGRAARLAEQMPPGMPVVAYAWPSGTAVASYSLDRDSATRSAPFLAETLKIVAGPGGARAVSLVGYGLGCRTLLDALAALSSGPASGAALGEVVLVAPDLEAGDLARRVAALSGVARGVTIYANAKDRGLDISRRFNGDVMPGGGVSESGPLLLSGVATIDATGASEGAVSSDIAKLLATGEREPVKRLPQIVLQSAANGQAYWRLPAGK